MAHERDTVDSKVAAIFREWAGDRVDRLRGSRPASEAIQKLAEGLASGYPDDVARRIAFHLADWNSDAAFLVAVHLFPERFTSEEIAEGVRGFVIHAPNHIAAAAKLAGYPIEDVFDLGALGEDGR